MDLFAFLGVRGDINGLIELFEKEGVNDSNTYWALGGAVEVNDIDLVKFVLQKGVSEAGLSNALFRACKNANREIIDLLIESGANDWESGLSGAAQGRHMDLVLWMIELGAKNFDRVGIYGACVGGDRAIIDLMIEKGATNWEEGISGAIYGSKIDAVKYMIERGAKVNCDIIGYAEEWCTDPDIITVLNAHLEPVVDS